MTAATDYLRPAQVGEIMGWSLNALANYRSRGEEPPYVKVRNRVLYPAIVLNGKELKAVIESKYCAAQFQYYCARRMRLVICAPVQGYRKS